MGRADSPLQGRVIFVVGARRSGTNWLERILTTHPRIAAVPTESHLFSHGIKPLTERFQHANPGAPAIGRMYLPREEFLDAVRALVDRAFEETLRGTEADYVVERTPWHASHLPLMAAVYPDARVLNIVRDGRDIARSLVAMPWGPKDIAEAAEEWRKSVVDAADGAASFGERFREVRYERLLESLGEEVASIFSFLEIPLDDATTQRIRLEAGTKFNEDPGSPAVRKEKWRDELSAADLRAFEAVAGDQLEALGYRRAAALPGVGERFSAQRIRGSVSSLRHPRAALDASRERWLRQRMHADQVAHNRTVADFERHVAVGERREALELLAPKVRVRMGLGDVQRTLRGAEAAEALLEALAEHAGAEYEEGQTHASPYGFTTFAVYALPDGSRWTRTLAYTVRGRRIREVGLYRHRAI